jgi:hypothetical protein
LVKSCDRNSLAEKAPLSSSAVLKPSLDPVFGIALDVDDRTELITLFADPGRKRSFHCFVV